LLNFEPRIGFAWIQAAEDARTRRFRHFDVLPLLTNSIFHFNVLSIRAVYFANTLQPGMFPTGAFRNSSNQSNSGLPLRRIQSKRDYVMRVESGCGPRTDVALSFTLLCRFREFTSLSRGHIDMVLPTLTAQGMCSRPPPRATRSTPISAVSIDSVASQFFYDALQADVANALPMDFDFMPLTLG